MPALTGEAAEAPQLTAFARAGEFLAGVKRLSDDTPDGQFLGGEEVDDGRLLEALCAMVSMPAPLQQLSSLTGIALAARRVPGAVVSPRPLPRVDGFSPHGDVPPHFAACALEETSSRR